MKPLGDRVIVRRIEAEEKIGRFYVPDNAQEKPQQGEVVKAGTKATEVKPGDQILFGKYSGIETKIKDEDYLILRQEEILVVL